MDVNYPNHLLRHRSAQRIEKYVQRLSHTLSRLKRKLPRGKFRKRFMKTLSQMLFRDMKISLFFCFPLVMTIRQNRRHI